MEDECLVLGLIAAAAVLVQVLVVREGGVGEELLRGRVVHRGLLEQRLPVAQRFVVARRTVCGIFTGLVGG